MTEPTTPDDADTPAPPAEAPSPEAPAAAAADAATADAEAPVAEASAATAVSPVDIPVTASPPAMTAADVAATREVTASPEPAITQQAPSSPPTVPYPPAPAAPAPPPTPPTYAAAPPGYPTAPPTGAAQPPAGTYPVSGSQPAVGHPGHGYPPGPQPPAAYPGYPATGAQPAVGQPAPGYPTTGSQPAVGRPGYPTTGSQPAVGHPGYPTTGAQPAVGHPGHGYPTTGSQPAVGYPGYPTSGNQPAVGQAPAGYPGYPTTGAQPAVGYAAAGPYGQQAPPAPPGYPPSGAYPPGFGPAPRRVSTEAGGRRALLAVAVVLAVLAGGFAVVNLRATPTGAGSPEGAVEQFFDAVADEDLVGVLEMLDPGERSVLLPFVRSLASELDRLELTSGFDPDDVGGFDIEVDGLETSPQELGPGVTEVAITAGVFRAETEPETVPVGDVLRDIVEANGGRIDVPREQEQGSIGADDGVFLVATETDGRWHLSLGFTIAEYARRDAGYEIPDLTGGVEPQGAASPEEAVRGMVDAAVGLDLERVISLLPPDEMRALQVYAPLFLEDAQDDLDDFRVDEDFDVTVDRLDLDTTEVGEGTRVIPTGGAFTMRDESGESTLSYEDGCLEVTGDAAEDFEDEFGQNRVCTEELAETDSNLSEEDEADLQALGELFAGFEPGVMTVERDGRWYVDPIRTVGDVGLQVLAGIEKEDLEEGGILYRLFTGDVFDAGFGYPDFEADDEFESDGCDIWDSEDGDC